MKRIACVACRQAKLKCETLESEVKCTRCKQKSLNCVADSEYKRYSKRSRVEDLSAEVKRLKSMLSQAPRDNEEEQQLTDSAAHNDSTSFLPAGPDGDASTSRQSHPQSSSAFPSSAHPIGSAVNTSTQASPTISGPVTRGNDRLAWYSTRISRELDGVRVDSKHITKLFQLFFSFFHPHMPILDDTMSPDDFYDRSVLLFWTIATIASKAHTEELGLYPRLTEPLTKMLWSKVSSIPQSHHTIQATVILCMWPFNTPTMIADPTFMLISIARTGCMQIGLHRPEAMQDYNRIRFQVQPAQIAEAVKLWVGCFVVAESVTSSEGQESLFVTADPTLRRACKDDNYYNIPKPLWRMLNIQLFLNRLHVSMASMTYAHQERKSQYEAGTLLSSFEDEVDRLGESLHNNAEDGPSLWLSCARLHVQLYYFHQSVESPSRKPGLLRAYHTAINLIKQIHSANVAIHFGHSCPHYFEQSLKDAALTIMKLIHSCYARVLDVEEGKHYFNTALSIHRSMSIEHNDFNGRASIFLSHSWTFFHHSAGINDMEPVLTLNTRHSASLLHECLWIWRDHFSTKKDDPLRRPPRTLPSIIQHSPSTSKSAVGTISEVGNEDNAENLSRPLRAGNVSHVTNDGQFGTDWLNSDVMTAGANNTDLALLQQDTMDVFSPGIFDMMNTYLGPDMEASGLFYP